MPIFKTDPDGATIYAFESPTGEDIEPGAVFKASGSWYEKRRGCAFLHPATNEELDAYQKAEGQDESDEEPDEAGPEGSKAPEGFEARVRALDWGDIRGLAADVETATGAEPDGGKKDDLVEFICDHEPQAEPLISQYEE